MTTSAQIDAFLACKRIGFAGVSTNPDDFSRSVFREFVARGYEVVPIHPTAKKIEGKPAFSNVRDATPLDGVLIMTPPSATEGIVEDCHRAGIKRVWMHRGVGGGSVEWHAVQYAKAFGIDVIEGECPMMFLPNTEAVHRAHASIRRAIGHYPDATVTEPLTHRTWRAVGWATIAWMLATWAMLAFGGMFDWQAATHVRVVVIPASLGLIAWLHASPGRLAPLPSAIWFVAVGVALDALVLSALIGFELTWLLPYGLGFAAAVALGTRHRRPVPALRLSRVAS